MAQLNIRWTEIALSDLEAISNFLINEDKPANARVVIQNILSGIEQIQSFPELGRKGRVAGTRELIIATTPFTVIYRIQKNEVQVLSVLHQSRILL